ncbi:MAG: ASKHA domain-containing protein, partial [Oscillospiraceae bacterium]|nr:ASKHA domain-containing protein [Oscillospiraceae bacterium]
LSDEDLRDNIRLACMCEVHGEICVENPGKTLQIQTTGIKSRDMSITQPKDGCGIAADIGTTTAAVYLYSLKTGELIDYAGIENPQRAYGADVISRINYTIENQNGLKELQKLILECLSGLIDRLCKKNNIPREEISDLVFAGNTVMQCITAGIDPKSIAFAPFTPPDLFGYEIPAEIFFDNLNKTAQIYFMPAIASYVGGDISAGCIAADLDLSEKTTLFLDVGTNGEIGLGNSKNLIFCAAAAGPAFEGAHIECGTAGIPGAVNKITLGENKKIICETIENAEPIGICGSGIIDACAVMLELGILDETGLIELEENDDDIFKICEKIYISQKDIREIQLAKSAISAGIATLLHYSGKTLADIDEVILAGGFGAHINKKSACRIGLIPPELEAKIKTAGNAAGMGASAVLLNGTARERAKNLGGISSYIELSGDAFFMDEYIERMMF